MSQKSYNDTPSLYLIPTPIGNMEDLTYRTVSTLKLVDVLFSEDTRVTAQLLKYLDIKKKLYANHEHNEITNRELILKFLEDGKNVGLVSDRGTPVISDPGYELTKFVIEKGYNVIALPGPTALIPALIVSGLPPMPFLFYGFLNSKESKRKKELESLKKERATMIFYEAPHRIIDTLETMKSVLGNRKISISREITKKYEEIYRGTVEEVISQLDNIKGEFVLVVEGAKININYNDIPIKEHIDFYLSQGFDLKESMKLVAKERKLSKSDVYRDYQRGDS